MQSSQKTIQKKEEIKLPTEKPTQNTSSNTDMGNIWVKSASAKPETRINTGVLADIPKLSPMMREYCKTKEEYKDCVLFYRLGDFYEMFFDDAIMVSFMQQKPT